LFRAYKDKIVFKTFQQLLFYFFFYTPKFKSIFTAMKHTIYIAVFFLCSCANVVAPTGGEKDTSPPKVVDILPKDKTIGFSETDITFVFDELIQTNNIENVFCSPYSKDAVTLTINKNKLKVVFTEELKENTTYYLNLNNVIKDVNEGNVMNQLDYLFSTGEKIDTLTISGHIIDAVTAKPLKDVWVGLYKNDNDSLLYKETPIYIVKSTDGGLFSFSNLPLGSYNIYAIEDLDNNLRFTIPNEKVGFYTKKVASQSTDIELRIFDETALADTIRPILNDSSVIGFGKLIIDSLPTHTSLIIELLKNDDIILRTKGTFPTIIDSLTAGKYHLRIIEDENKNGIWDSGNLIEKKQAESVRLYPKEIVIRENWDVLIEWDTN
jgi:uncharacterized protein (DUF2141 family)